MKQTKTQKAIETAKQDQKANETTKQVTETVQKNKVKSNKLTDSEKLERKLTKIAAFNLADSEQRGYNANLRTWQTVYNSKDKNVIDLFGLVNPNFTIGFFNIQNIFEYLPERFFVDEKNNKVLCNKEKYKDEKSSVYVNTIVNEKSGQKYGIYIQKTWTVKQFFSMFAAAYKAKIKKQKEQDKEQKLIEKLANDKTKKLELFEQLKKELNL